MTIHNYAQIGSVSSGTMVTEDVFNACISALEDLDTKAARQIQHDWDNVEMECSSRNNDDHDTGDCADCEEIRSDILNNDLWNALNDRCPSYVYFGANEGDGCNYGFWINFDSLEDDVKNGEVLKVNDTSEIPSDYKGYIMLVNDHGNVTLYEQTSKRSRKKIWSCA